MMSDDSFLETFNTKNSIFENLKLPLDQKYSITSINSVTLASTALAQTKNGSVISQFNEEKGEEEKYFVFQRPCGDYDKVIRLGFEEKNRVGRNNLTEED